MMQVVEKGKEKEKEKAENNNINISFTPHHGCMTKAGAANFSRICDAQAEFIDNSIQAYSILHNLEVESRDIFLRLYLSQSSSKSSFFLIADKGKGMDWEEIQEFATHSLDQVTKGYQPIPGIKDGISKFGVGAKQSGFFLARRIRMLTKSAINGNNSSSSSSSSSSSGGSRRRSSGNQNNNEYLEFVMDEDEYNEKYHSKANVYDDTISIKKVGDAVDFTPDEMAMPSMCKFVTDFTRENPSFSIFILKLRKERVAELKNENSKTHYRYIPCSLCDIYYFHMKPQHHPRRFFSSPEGKPLVDTSLKDFKDDISIADEEQEPTLMLWFHVTDGNHVIIDIDLNRLDCNVSDNIKNAKSAFKFEIEIPVDGSTPAAAWEEGLPLSLPPESYKIHQILQ